MKKLRAFLYIFSKSLTSFTYYRDLVKTKFSFSVKYLIFLVFLGSLVITARSGYTAVKGFNKTVKELSVSAKSFYPDDLVFTVEKGEWSVNRPEPFMIAFPKIEGEPGVDESVAPENPENLVVFDKAGTIDDLEKYKTTILVNSVNIIFKEDTGSLKVVPIKDIPDTKIDKAMYLTLLAKLEGLAGIIPFMLVIGIFFGSFFAFTIFRVPYFAIVGFFIYLGGKIMKAGLGYTNAVKIAIHSATLSFLIMLGLNLVNYQLPIPSWFFLINLVFGLVAVGKLADKTPVEIDGAGESDEAKETSGETSMGEKVS
jgi:hypothetical protein